MVSGYDNKKVGEQELIVTYREMNATFKVTVTEKDLGIDLGKYTLKQEIYIIGIQPNTKIKDLEIKAINGEMKITKEEQEIEDEEVIIETGNKITITNETETKRYVLVIKGDCNGDGQANFQDILKINKHRLNKVKLQGAYREAGEINGDGKVDFKDILMINKFRLNKITEL